MLLVSKQLVPPAPLLAVPPLELSSRPLLWTVPHPQLNPASSADPLSHFGIPLLFPSRFAFLLSQS